MKRKIVAALASAGVIGFSVLAYAAGLWPDFPIVGSATYCAGTSSSATGTIIGVVTGCPNQVAAGPTILTGNELIPADTKLASGAQPQTVLVPMASLNSLPITFSAVTTTSPTVSAANTSGGIVFTSAATITAANISLPVAPIQGQQYAVCANRTITTLAVTPTNNTATGVGTGTINMGGNTAPTVLTASTAVAMCYRFVYNAADTNWYRLQ